MQFLPRNDDPNAYFGPPPYPGFGPPPPPYGYGQQPPPYGYGQPPMGPRLSNINLGALIPVATVLINAFRTPPDAPSLTDINNADPAGQTALTISYIKSLQKFQQSQQRWDAGSLLAGYLLKNVRL